jgi:hypothetical protein
LEKGKERKVLDLEEFKVCEVVWSAANCLVVRHKSATTSNYIQHHQHKQQQQQQQHEMRIQK